MFPSQSCSSVVSIPSTAKTNFLLFPHTHQYKINPVLCKAELVNVHQWKSHDIALSKDGVVVGLHLPNSLYCMAHEYYKYPVGP